MGAGSVVGYNRCCELFEQGWWGLGWIGLEGDGRETWLDWGICDNMCWQARGRTGGKGGNSGIKCYMEVLYRGRWLTIICEQNARNM